MKWTRDGKGWASPWRVTALACVVSLLTVAAIQAQPARGEARTIEGKVRSLTTAPRGEIDGAVLSDGTVIHWPPHLEDRFRDLAARGQRIRVTGRMETGPEGDTHLEVESLTNLRTRMSAENDTPEPLARRGPRGPRGRDIGAGEEAKTLGGTVRGTVRSVTRAPRGEVDGVVLDDGTVIHWPPHLEERFGPLAAKGERIRVTGRMETGPEGDTHLEVQTLTNLRTRESQANEGEPPVPEPRRRASSRPADRQQRLQQLEQQVEELRREIDRLRREE